LVTLTKHLAPRNLVEPQAAAKLKRMFASVQVNLAAN
jgi:hypothetical protein